MTLPRKKNSTTSSITERFDSLLEESGFFNLVDDELAGEEGSEDEYSVHPDASPNNKRVTPMRSVRQKPVDHIPSSMELSQEEDSEVVRSRGVVGIPQTLLIRMAAEVDDDEPSCGCGCGESLSKSLSGLLSEERNNQDVGAYKNRPLFDIKYKKMVLSDSGNLAIVRRIGWDSVAGSDYRYSVIHVPTRTDLTTTFKDLGEAEKFLKDAESKWDWNFTHLGGPESKKIDQDELYRLAGKHNALDMLGNPILTNAGRE